MTEEKNLQPKKLLHNEDTTFSTPLSESRVGYILACARA
jgi:hypothetical protein